MRLEGLTVAVTGATRGIGRALVVGLLDRGATVLAVARDAGALDALAAGAPEGRVRAVSADLANASEVLELAEMLAQDPLDGLINNAGVQTETDLAATPPARLVEVARREAAVNLVAPAILCGTLLSTLARAPRGFVVNVTSGVALAPKAAAPVYSATKAGLRSFTRGLRYQAEATAPRVLVNEAIMALTDTDMTAGRGRGKITPETAARAVLDGVEREREETWVGRARLLPMLGRLSPALVARIMR